MARAVAPSQRSQFPELPSVAPLNHLDYSLLGLALLEEDEEPNTGSAAPLPSKAVGAVLPELPGASLSSSFDLRGDHFVSLDSSQFAASYSSLPAELSAPPEVLLAEMPRLPPHLRIRTAPQRKTQGPKRRIRKDDSDSGLRCLQDGVTWIRDDDPKMIKTESCSSDTFFAMSGARGRFGHGSSTARERFGHPHAKKKLSAEETVRDFLEAYRDREEELVHAKEEAEAEAEEPDHYEPAHGLGGPGYRSSVQWQPRASQIKNSATPIRGIGRDSFVPASPSSARKAVDGAQKVLGLQINVSTHGTANSHSNHQQDEHHVDASHLAMPVLARKSFITIHKMQAEVTRQMPIAEEKVKKIRKSVFSGGGAKLAMNDRMKRVQERRGSQEREIKIQKRHEQRVLLFAHVPHKEQTALSQAFARFDVDHSGTLNHTEVTACLSEFGLAGTTAQEKRAILNICCEAMVSDSETSSKKKVSTENVEISLLDLALVVVPRVRMAMVDHRGGDLLKEFFKYDSDNSGGLSKDELKELARGMGLDPRMMEVPGRPPDEEIDFETFQAMMIQGREQLQRVCRDRERAVQTKVGLAESDFIEFRSDLVGLYDSFVRYDKDGSNTLSITELMLMLRESGLAPKNLTEKQDWLNMFKRQDKNGDKEFDFCEFLHLVRQVRQYRQAERREKLVERFLKYDRDKSGHLSASEISLLLSDLGLVPKNRKQQEELSYIIASVDTDGSGFIDFLEFQELSQRIDEKLKIAQNEEEIIEAMCMGFTEKQMRELRWVFDTLDVDGGDSLDANEVRNGLLIMRKDIPRKTFEPLFKSIDVDDSGFLNFLEFLSLIKLLRESEGDKNTEDVHKLPTKPALLETRILRQVLEYFRMNASYVQSLHQDDLVGLFCEYFKVAPTTNLHEALDVRTVGGLYEAAQRRDQIMMLEVKQLR